MIQTLFKLNLPTTRASSLPPTPVHSFIAPPPPPAPIYQWINPSNRAAAAAAAACALCMLELGPVRYAHIDMSHADVALLVKDSKIAFRSCIQCFNMSSAVDTWKWIHQR